jgi:hypothetical protein
MSWILLQIYKNPHYGDPFLGLILITIHTSQNMVDLILGLNFGVWALGL